MPYQPGMHANDWDAIGAIRKIGRANQVMDHLQDESLSSARIAATLG
jgi:hypothetical protein